MPTKTVVITANQWTRITDPGQSAICFKKTNARLVVDHTTAETADTLSITNTNVTIDKSKRVPYDFPNAEVLPLRADDGDDVFYAILAEDKADGGLVVDILPVSAPCLDGILGWTEWETTNNAGETELVNLVDGGDNWKVKGYAGDFDGVAKILAPHLTGSENVVDSGGTSTPTVGSGGINFTAGWCNFVELDNGDYYVIESASDAPQNAVFEVGNNNPAFLFNHPTPFFITQIPSSYLVENGFAKVENLIRGSEDTNNSAWVAQGGASVDGAGVVTFVENSQFTQQVASGIPNIAGKTVTAKFKLRGNGDVRLQIGELPSFALAANDPVTLTPTQQEFTVVGTLSGAATGLTITYRANQAAPFTMEMDQLHVTCEDGAYIKTEDDIVTLSYAPDGVTGVDTTNPAGTASALEDVADINAPDVQAWKDADVTLGDFWFTGGVPNDILIGNITDINFQQFIEILIALLVYEADISGSCLEETDSYLGKYRPSLKFNDARNSFHFGM